MRGNMKKLSEIKLRQKEFIDQCRVKANNFIDSIECGNLEVILLSGSVARGDFMPGKFGGMIDLTVMKPKDSTVGAEDIFGKDEEPDIPYHCVKYSGEWFQIAFHDFITENDFNRLDESKKFALLESEILWERDGIYSDMMNKIDLGEKLDSEKKRGIGYINYLISDYKKDRWISREGYPQLHSNLSLAIQVAIRCLFYVNCKYAPAEDRRLYYSYDLTELPSGYSGVIGEIFRQDIYSYKDYTRREKVFIEEFLPFLKG